MEFSIGGLWESMGVAAQAVVIILALLSVYSIGIMVDRVLLIRRTWRQSRAFAELLSAEGELPPLDTVMEMARDPDRGENCYLAHIVAEALEEARPLLSSAAVAGLALESAHKAASRSVVVVVATLRRRMVQLTSAATGAPFIGLFGTVLGLIRAFQTIATTGSGGIASVSAGIAEALITTLVGLFVAIPALWAHNVIGDRIDALAVELDSTASRTVERLLKRELVRAAS